MVYSSEVIGADIINGSGNFIDAYQPGETGYPSQ